LQNLPPISNSLEVEFHQGFVYHNDDETQRFLTLQEIFEKFPGMPLNIDIKTDNDTLIGKVTCISSMLLVVHTAANRCFYIKQYFFPQCRNRVVVWKQKEKSQELFALSKAINWSLQWREKISNGFSLDWHLLLCMSRSSYTCYLEIVWLHHFIKVSIPLLFLRAPHGFALSKNVGGRNFPRSGWPAMSNPQPTGRMRPSRRFCAVQFGFSMQYKQPTYWQPPLILINLYLMFLTKAVVSATLSRLYCMLVDFHMLTDTLEQNI